MPLRLKSQADNLLYPMSILIATTSARRLANKRKNVCTDRERESEGKRDRVKTQNCQRLKYKNEKLNALQLTYDLLVTRDKSLKMEDLKKYCDFSNLADGDYQYNANTQTTQLHLEKKF